MSCLLLFFCVSAHALGLESIILLRSGDVIKGEIVSQGPNEVTVRKGGDEITFSTGEIQAVFMEGEIPNEYMKLRRRLVQKKFTEEEGSRWDGNITLFYGIKRLESDWGSQDETGVKMDFKGEEWPVSIAIDYLMAKDSAPFYNAETSEINLGARKVWEVWALRLFSGLGIAFVSAECPGGFGGPGGIPVSESYTRTGFWLNAGAVYRMGSHLSLGFDIRYSYADTGGLVGNAGGLHGGVLAGYSW